jgi:hypothetical protein
MANIFQSTRSLTLAKYLTTVAFATVAVCSPPLMAVPGGGFNLDDINFGIKIEKLYQKVKKALDKGETNRIVGYMFDFKSEVEQYTGQKIDINKQLDQVQREARAKGQKSMTNTSSKSRKSSASKTRSISIALFGSLNALNSIFLILLKKPTFNLI